MSATSSNAYICARCLLKTRHAFWTAQRRKISTSAAALPTAAFAPLKARRLISLSGVDAPKYLQGLISANVPKPSSEPQSAFYSAFLNAAGRVLHDVFIYPTQHLGGWRNRAPESEKDGGFLIEVDADEVDSLYRQLKRYKLRAKVGLRVVDQGEWMAWSAWGDAQQGKAMSYTDSRLPDGIMGSRVLMSGDAKPPLDLEEASSEAYDLRRILLGVPEGQKEIIKESALPQESNIDYMGGVDFRKGCYVGQELTIRTHHTGVVRKRILQVQLFGMQEQQPEILKYDENSSLMIPPPGANISRVGKKGRSAGKWLGGVGNVGLALCRLEVMTDTVLTDAGGQWSPDHEFKVVWQDEAGGEQREVKVKAFVPEWHKERAEAQRVQKPHG